MVETDALIKKGLKPVSVRLILAMVSPYVETDALIKKGLKLLLREHQLLQPLVC